MDDYEAKKGKLAGDKIRKLLFNIDLNIVYAKGSEKLANENFKLNQKIKNPKNQKKAMQAKIEKECYKVYLRNLEDTKQEIEIELNKILNRYAPKYKTIWLMYFIQQSTIEEIAKATNYTIDNVNKIIKKLKNDLCIVYDNEINKRK